MKFSTGMKNQKSKIKNTFGFTQHQISFFKKKKFDAGFTLLFASLIGALVLAVGLAILSIALKQLQLSASGRESQKAFYSADAGVECALFLDRGGVDSDCRLGFFGTPTTTVALTDVVVCGGNVVDPAYQECFGKQVPVSVGSYLTDINGTAYVVSSFSLNSLSTSGGNSGDNYEMCFNVEVKKSIDNPSMPDDQTSTIIESRGYNNCNDTASNRYERAIRVKNF